MINFQAHLLLYPREITTVKVHQCSYWEEYYFDCKSTKDQKACGRRFVKEETGELLDRSLFRMSQYDKNGNFKACTTDSFSTYHEVKISNSNYISAIQSSGNLPEVTVKSFVMPSYGAGQEGPNYFDRNCSYIGFIILAINHQQRWYTDSQTPFRYLFLFTRGVFHRYCSQILNNELDTNIYLEYVTLIQSQNEIIYRTLNLDIS